MTPEHPELATEGTTHAEGSSSNPRFVSQLTKNAFALILAGGRGARLKQLTDWRAKPGLAFGGKFKIIDFALSNCVNSGVRRIGVATQYKSHSLIQHIQRGWSFLDGRFDEFVQLLPAQQRIQESWYRGTADAIFQNLDILREHGPEHVVILAGDHIYKMDYGKLLAWHVSRQADLTVACVDVPRDEAREFGVMDVDADNRIREFHEKPAEPPTLPDDPTRSLASMGVYVFNAAFLYEQVIRDADEPHSTHDFGHDLIPHLVPRYRVFAHRFADSCVRAEGEATYWRDVGTIDAFWEANLELTRVTPALNMYDSTWPIWTYQEQLPPAKFVFDEQDRRGMAVDSLISGGCIISGALVRGSLLYSGVHAHSYSTIEASVLLSGVDVGRNARLRRVIIDEGARIPEGMTIGYDSAADRQRFHVSERGVTLVTAEMLGQSQRRNR
ncbi:MAG: glucose-1-phosphate adenylyltransferase [Proteobacteria bacterium]|nr:glucose-1-phosphate adenylyltransferase [Burkholderiales bacterium]